MRAEELREKLAAPLQLRNRMRLPSRAVMAPMEGLMNSPRFFRAVQALGLAEFWMTPFLGLSKNAVPTPAALRRKYKGYLAENIPFFLQYLGHDPEAAAEGVLHAARAGIRGVNFNFACPSRTVLKSGSGGAVLLDPSLVEKILLAARKAVPEMCISVKMRIGVRDPAECTSLLSAMKNADVDLVICHARTVEENYSPLPEEEKRKRMSFAAEKAGKIPFFGNGDIRDEMTAALYMESGCDGVAVARGLLQDPWILRRLRGEESPPPEAARKRFLEEFGKLLSGKQGAGTFAECVKLAYGEDSPQFRTCLEAFRGNRRSPANT